MRTQRTAPVANSSEAGFTLLEMLIATMLMGFILTALVTVTAQWLPNWNRGMARVQRAEHFAFGINRLVEDLSVAEIVPANNAAKTLLFDGNELGVTLVRTAVGPNSHPGLEVIRFQEVADVNGPAFIRQRTAYAPMDAGMQLRFADPTVLIRAPFRISFAYAGPGGVWQPNWRDAAELPRTIRITVRDGVTQQTLAVSTVAPVHINASAACVRAQNVNQCLQLAAQKAGADAKAQASAEPR